MHLWNIKSKNLNVNIFILVLLKYITSLIFIKGMLASPQQIACLHVSVCLFKILYLNKESLQDLLKSWKSKTIWSRRIFLVRLWKCYISNVAFHIKDLKWVRFPLMLYYTAVCCYKLFFHWIRKSCLTIYINPIRVGGGSSGPGSHGTPF